MGGHDASMLHLSAGEGGREEDEIIRIVLDERFAVRKEEQALCTNSRNQHCGKEGNKTMLLAALVLASDSILPS